MDIELPEEPEPDQLVFLGRTQRDLAELPGAVREDIDNALDLAIHGERGAHAKMLKGFGGGTVLEVVENYQGDTYRAVYTVRFEEFVFVLHVFKKKSKSGIKTPQQDIETIERRLKLAAENHPQLLARRREERERRRQAQEHRREP